ncbi:chromate transporter [Priestia taiwanensis]|uniref:Chromate transporter n=1 Tax=Priestia taiwanensis TaxID=1347902 RepID=A0A917APL1_9BACI|nr:chromate transporter [Priestia taiwanensis]MBM7362374.1 chromate transporter [Priestia taiwanensis]GGE61651.1 chromate transporter [Priestia taiwanensis]
MKKPTYATLWEILLVSMRLGCTSFGGPVAHLGYFYEEYVRKRKWMDEKSYVDLVALCQFLPGPASSQVGIGIGVMRGGLLGGILAFIGFTLPSVIALILFALLLQGFGIGEASWIHGLKIVAVAIVAHAIVGMAEKLAPDLQRKSLVLFALVGTLVWQTAFTQVGVILIAGAVGYLLYKNIESKEEASFHFPLSKRFGATCLALFFGLLLALPIIREITSLEWVTMFDSFYRAGSLVFGGGHVVLPLLEREFVPTGWLSEEVFLAGYGATQAMPGPLFTFAAYIGAIINGWQGALIATIAIFLPAFLLILGALPFWDKLRRNRNIKGAFMGVNAAVVGILIAAFYDPIWTSAILTPVDFAFAAILFSMLMYWKVAPWIVVVTGVIGGVLLGLL